MSFGVSIGDVLKLCEVASRVYKNCRDCTGEYRSLTGEARNLTNILEDLSDKLNSIPDKKKNQFLDAYGSCVAVLEELDKILLHYNSLDTKSKRAWDRLKWDAEKFRTLREKLTSSVVMLNAFYTALIHDKQVLILEALTRLEVDYRGGHREESIATVEQMTTGSDLTEREEHEELAWTYITRDLEDVGISVQIAMEHRALIVDWFVRAVNEGRLLEAAGHQGEMLDGWQTDLGAGMPVPPTNELVSASTPPSQELEGRNDTLQTRISELEIVNDLFRTRVDEIEAPEYSDLLSRAHLIASAWGSSQFPDAERLLEEQLAAVENGHTVTMNGRTFQPERRLLRHLIGACASYSGNFAKAKLYFESVFSDLYLDGPHIDLGDIAAARWLGDVCLHLGETKNTALAWGVALNGLITHHGSLKETTQRACDELHLFEHRFQCLQKMANSTNDIDSTTIFKRTSRHEKCKLIAAVLERVRQMRTRRPESTDHSLNGRLPKNTRLSRAHCDWRQINEYLTQPVAASSFWPLQWDETFSPSETIDLHWHMSETRLYAELQSDPYGFGFVNQSKAMHFVTKKDMTWLVQTVQSALEYRHIEYRTSGSVMIIRLEQKRSNFLYFHGVVIKFKKPKLRSGCGLKVSDVMFSTRRRSDGGPGDLASPDNFREKLINCLKGADNTTELHHARPGNSEKSTGLYSNSGYNGELYHMARKASDL